MGKSIFQIIDKNGVRSPALVCLADEFQDSLRKVYDDESLKTVYVLVIATLEDGDTGVIDRRGISRFPVVTGYTFCNLESNDESLAVPVVDDVVPDPVVSGGSVFAHV